MSDSFTYKALSPDGRRESGVMDADSPERVAARLAENGLIPVEIRPHKRPTRFSLFGFLTGRRYEELILFTRNFATLYRAGIPILRALSVIKVGAPDGRFNQVIADIKKQVETGMALSAAMARASNIFPQVYVAAIEAGEVSGQLDLILDSLSEMLEKEMELNRQIKSSLRYPFLVLTTISVAMAVLITFVIPRFMAFYAKMGATLPLPTRILIGLNEIITSYWPLVIGGIAVGLVVIKKIYDSASGRHFFDFHILKIPVFGDLIIKGNIARFAHMLKILIKSGIPLVRTLDILSGVIKNTQLAREIKALGEAFREGRSIDSIGSKLIFFPDMARQLLQIGMESGAMDDTMAEVSAHYSKEVDYTSRQLTSLLEPLLTVTLAVFVLLVALAIFLPMWDLIKTFRG